MGRIFFFILMVISGWYCYSTGILDFVLNGGIPKNGWQCQVCGPTGNGVYLAATPDIAELEIDSHIGTQADKLAGYLAVAQCVKTGEIGILADHTKVKVLESKRVFVEKAPYWLVKIKVLNGEYEDSEGWIDRNNLIDTPIREIYQNMRTVTVHTKRSVQY